MDKRVAATAVLVALLNLFLYRNTGSTGLVLAMGAVWVFTALLWERGQTKTLAAATLITFVSSFILVTTAGTVPGLLAFLMWLTTIAGSIYLSAKKKDWFADLGELAATPFILGFSWLASGISVLEKFFSSKNQGKFWPTIRGILLGIPVIVILSALLGSADPVFNHYLGSLFSSSTWERVLGHAIFSAVLTGVFLPLAFLKLISNPAGQAPGKRFLETELKIVMIMTAILLGLFLAVQWNYVFANVEAETSLIKYGVATYSEYVKRGFGEFILVFGIIYWLVRIGKVNKKLSALLIAELAILFISVSRRIYLYQDFHGWTLARIYGGIFLLWMAGLTIILTGRWFTKRNLLNLEAGWTFALIIFAGLFNAEAFTATTRPPTVNKNIDYVYLSRMSADGYAGWKKAADYAHTVLNKDYSAQIINTDQRREIFYAGMIVQNLTGKYNVLENNYDYADRWDKLLVWNKPEAEAWKKMRAEISGGQLAILNDKYQRLQNQISSQPENERNVDIDISTGSLFLK